LQMFSNSSSHNNSSSHYNMTSTSQSAKY